MRGEHEFLKRHSASALCVECGILSSATSGIFNTLCPNCLEKKKALKNREFNPNEKGVKTKERFADLMMDCNQKVATKSKRRFDLLKKPPINCKSCYLYTRNWQLKWGCTGAGVKKGFEHLPFNPENQILTGCNNYKFNIMARRKAGF